MTRVMYFESIRSSDEGMLAVGTVVMNRMESKEFPNSVCGVVGQKNQFAPGVLSRPMQEGKSMERAERVARAVLNGKRHRGVGNAMYFHTAGRTYRYSNMHYVLVAGGNAFYTRNPTRGRSYIPRTQIAMAGPTTSLEAGRGFARASRPSSERLLAVAPAPAPRPAGPAETTIEQLIFASAGW
jgi:spore germination cell wall hydrolase CwlJ-like protein